MKLLCYRECAHALLPRNKDLFVKHPFASAASATYATPQSWSASCLWAVLMLVVTFYLGCGTALAAFEGMADTETPWKLNADSLTSIDDGIIVEAAGDVVLQRGSDYLKADFARYFTSTDWILLQGNVTVRLGEDELVASEAEFDLKSNTGWLKDGSVFMAGPHIYFKGDNVIKHWGDRYTFQNAKVTACDGPVPAWSMVAQEAVVEIDGYATLSHSAFQVLDTSVLFAPYMIVPAKTTRQSGLLMPDGGYSSRKGLYVTQPYFWAIDKSHDLTFYGTVMTKVGFMPSVEYRSKTSDKDQTWLALDLLYDKNKVSYDWDDNVDNSDGMVRQNQLRYWFRGMSNGQIGESKWQYKYNVDFTSDQNFLREFKDLMTGFDATQDSTYELFGRDLREADRNRVTEGYVYRDWERFRLTIGGRYEQDPVFGHGNLSAKYDTTPQHLPMLNAFMYKSRPLAALPLEMEVAASTAYIARRTGTNGFRAEIYPRFSLPLDLKYATVLASAGVRHTMYHSNTQGYTSLITPGTPAPTKQLGTSRTIPDLHLTAFTQASRIWDMRNGSSLEVRPENAGASEWMALRHVIQPRLEYQRTPNVNQEDNPFYTLDDRLLPENLLSLDITNLFTVRKNVVMADPAPEGQAPVSASLVPEYQDIFRLRIGGGYDFEEASRTKYRNAYERRPLLDLHAELEFNISTWLDAWSKSYLSLYGNGFTRVDTGLRFTNDRWGSWDVSYSKRNRFYDYRRQMQYDNIQDIHTTEALSLLNNSLNIRVSSRFSLLLSDYTNLRTGKNYERRVGIAFSDQCYRIIGRYKHTPKDDSFQLVVELTGLFD